LHGATEIHLVDLNGARSGEDRTATDHNDEVLSDVLSMPGLEVQIGGGIRSRARAESYLSHGAARVVVGSTVVDNLELFSDLCREFPGQIVASLDYRRVAGQRLVSTHGWEDSSDLRLLDGCERVVSAGCNRVLCTDVSRDGMLEGADLETYAEILEDFDLELIASGGVGSIQDLERLDSVSAGGRSLFGVVVGRAFLEGHIDTSEALGRWSR
jgi:phosphoribosylformimino-5-aminoimidazole carboxamide ribotide isomerase